MCVCVHLTLGRLSWQLHDKRKGCVCVRLGPEPNLQCNTHTRTGCDCMGNFVQLSRQSGPPLLLALLFLPCSLSLSLLPCSLSLSLPRLPHLASLLDRYRCRCHADGPGRGLLYSDLEMEQQGNPPERPQRGQDRQEFSGKHSVRPTERGRR